jgi:hypothetical protein
MNAIKMSDEIWYFEDAVDNCEEILESIGDWKPNANQDYMVTSQIKTRDYLEMTDDAIFKCLDIWYKNHLNLNSSKHKVAQTFHNQTTAHLKRCRGDKQQSTKFKTFGGRRAITAATTSIRKH